MPFREGGPRQNRPQEARREKDYYERLGVGRDASQKTISEAFRALSKKLHTDTGEGNLEAMQEASEAYATLKNPEKRAVYDATRPLVARATASPDFGFSDIYSDVFGRSPRSRERTSTRNEPPKAPQEEKPKEKKEEPPKPPERLTPEQIKKEAIHLARGYASDYGSFIKKLKADNYSDVDNLVHEPEIEEEIKKRALSRAWEDAQSYGLTMKGWAEVGFDRSKIDSSPELLAIIHKKLLSDVPLPTMFGNQLREWERNNPAIRTADILAQPEILASIKHYADRARQEDADDIKRYGQSELMRDRWFNNFVKRWRDEAKIDVLTLGI